MTARSALLGILLLAPASGTLAAWVVNGEGQCVREWTPGSLARGPKAMLNAPLVPFRTALGGMLLARDDRTPNPGLPRRVFLPPALTAFGGAMGLVESGIWLCTGLADTVTGGYFEVASDEATELGVGPMTPPLSETRSEPVSRCPPGRAAAR